MGAAVHSLEKHGAPEPKKGGLCRPFLFWVVANLRLLPGGVFHRLVGLQLVVVEFAIDPLDLAHIDDDAAGFGIDRHRSARAGHCVHWRLPQLW